MNQHLINKINRILMMWTIVLAGVIYSSVAEAKGPGKGKPGKNRYRASFVHSNSNRTCYLLHKKRINSKNMAVSIASRKFKFKPMAETDAPARTSSSSY